MPRKQYEKVIDKLLQHSMNSYIQALPQHERVIFKLYLDGLTAEQIAFHLGGSSSLETVRIIIEKVKQQLLKAYSACLTSN